MNIFCQSVLTILIILQDSWRDLANAFANGETLFMLNTAHQVKLCYALTQSCFHLIKPIHILLCQRSLAQTLVRSASGIRNSESANQ